MKMKAGKEALPECVVDDREVLHVIELQVGSSWDHCCKECGDLWL